MYCVFKPDYPYENSIPDGFSFEINNETDICPNNIGELKLE